MIEFTIIIVVIINVGIFTILMALGHLARTWYNSHLKRVRRPCEETIDSLRERLTAAHRTIRDLQHKYENEEAVQQREFEAYRQMILKQATMNAGMKCVEMTSNSRD